MVKKQYLLFISCLLLVLFMDTGPSVARNYLQKTASSIELTASTTDLGSLSPGASAVTQQINVSYTYQRFARPQGFPFPGRKTASIINLSIVDAPSWCNASLDPTSISIPINGFFSINTVNVSSVLAIRIPSLAASAFSTGKIRLLAEAAVNGNIQPSSSTLEFSVEVGFYSNINWSCSNTSLTLQPGDMTTVNFTVENQGNAPVVVWINNESSNESMIMVEKPDDVTIDIGEIATIIVGFQSAEHEFNETVSDTLTFFVEGYAASDESLSFSSDDIKLSVTILKGSVEDTSLVDLQPFVLGVVGAFIILYLLLTLIYWKRQQ